jgi:hypothetical protein
MRRSYTLRSPTESATVRVAMMPVMPAKFALHAAFVPGAVVTGLDLLANRRGRHRRVALVLPGKGGHGDRGGRGEHKSSK